MSRAHLVAAAIAASVRAPELASDLASRAVACYAAGDDERSARLEALVRAINAERDARRLARAA